jgi:hypothetical protein
MTCIFSNPVRFGIIQVGGPADNARKAFQLRLEQAGATDVKVQPAYAGSMPLSFAPPADFRPELTKPAERGYEFLKGMEGVEEVFEAHGFGKRLKYGDDYIRWDGNQSGYSLSRF